MSIEVRGVCALLQVFDMPASVRFYRDVLGFEIVQTSKREGDQFDWGLLRLDDAEVMLNTAYEQDDRPAVPDPARVAAHRDTCLYFGCPDVDAGYRHLQAHGVDVEEPKVAPYGMKQLYDLARLTRPRAPWNPILGTGNDLRCAGAGFSGVASLPWRPGSRSCQGKGRPRARSRCFRRTRRHLDRVRSRSRAHALESFPSHLARSARCPYYAASEARSRGSARAPRDTSLVEGARPRISRSRVTIPTPWR